MRPQRERKTTARSAYRDRSYERPAGRETSSRRSQPEKRDPAEAYKRYLAENARQKERRKKLAFAIFAGAASMLIILMAVMLRTVSDNRSFNDYMEQARNYYYSSNFDSALTYLRKAAAIDPTDECLAMTAQCYESQGNYDKALETLRRMDTSNPQVSSWIAELEDRKSVIRESEMVTVAGKQFKGDTTGLALDNMGLGDNVIQELLQLYSLDNLSLSGNNISDISALSQLGGLTTLNLSNNMISNISALSSLTGLRTLYLDNNPIADLSPLAGLTNLTTLSIKGMVLSEGQLRQLAAALPNCAIHSETATEEVQDISFGGATFSTDVVELNLSGMGIQNISALSSCKNLEKLDLSGNYISDLSPLMDLPRLRWLNIANNAVFDLRPLMGISSLRFLNASGNQFTSTVALGNLTGLTELHLSDNNIVDLSGVTKLRSLQTLGLSNCNLNDDSLMGLLYLTGLRYLNIENNRNLSGEAVDTLRRTLYACEVTHSALTYMVSIDGYSLPNDTSYIDLSGLNIYNLTNFEKFQNPETVNLARNNISNLYVLNNMPNRYLIRHLDLSYNALSDITPIAGLINLETLNLSYNMISSELPLLSLYSLRQLDVRGTMLSEAQVRIIRDTLTGCNVISDYGW